MIAIGAGGLDVAVAMGGGEFYITCPKVYKINLKGSPSALGQRQRCGPEDAGDIHGEG